MKRYEPTTNCENAVMVESDNGEYVDYVDAEMLRSKLSEACNIIRWFRENDETNQGDTPLPEHGGKTWDELNAYWIEGLNRANKFLIENDAVSLPR